MTKLVGIITEYNPFHNGHRFHIEKAKELSKAEAVLAVMSGDYVQRGEPAILDKYLRTKAALLNGVDVVIELPSVFSTANAEFFAKASVRLLSEAGVTALCFGSESGDIERLKEVADWFDLSSESNEPYQKELKEQLSRGLSFPRASLNALQKMKGAEETKDLETPNNILAIEYLKAIKKINPSIVPFTVQRLSKHNENNLEGVFSSSGAIRNALLMGEYTLLKEVMPEPSLEILMSHIDHLTDFNELSPIFHYKLKALGAQGIKQISEVYEGLENRILASASRHYLLSDILTDVKTKRYTFAKVKRICLHLLLGMDKAFYFHHNLIGPSYLRILGFRKEKEYLLKKIIEHSSLPVITNMKKAPMILNPDGLALWEKEVFASDIYQLATKTKIEEKQEMSRALVIV